MRTERMTADEVRKAGKGRAPDRFVPPHRDIEFCMEEPDELTITIPALPPSKNRWDRLPKTKKPLPVPVLAAMRRQAWYDPWHSWFGCQYMAFGGGVKFEGKVEVEICFHFPDERNRDTVQNFAGYPPLMDALVRTGIIHDDGRKWCRLTVNPDPVMDGTRQTVIVIRRTEATR